MHVDNEEVYPNRLVTTRTVEIGGLTKAQLIQKLKQSDIRMNEYAERLLTDDRFTTSDTRYSLQTVEVTVGDLGFRDGATTDQIYQRAAEFGLALCPLELGPIYKIAVRRPARRGFRRRCTAKSSAIGLHYDSLKEADG